jgi:hypothetical protein
VTTNVSAAFILCERSGRWAASLRRHGLCEGVRLIETRSLTETEDRLAEAPLALLGLELTTATLDNVSGWISRGRANLGAKAVIVFAERGLRSCELLCREAGAIHFVDSELELFPLRALFDRYLSDPAFAKLDAEELSLAERIRASLPWYYA